MMASEEERAPAAPAGEGQEARETQEAHGGPRMPRLPLPGVSGMPGMPTGRAGRVLWWGGLAALAAFDVVEWPVAVLVGAGSWVAEQYAKAATAQERMKAAQRQGAEPPQGS
jgi:hypothetical protein